MNSIKFALKKKIQLVPKKRGEMLDASDGRKVTWKRNKNRWRESDAELLRRVLGATIVSIDLSESALANDCDGQVHCTWTCLPRGWDARSGWWVAGPGGRGQLKQLRFPSAATLL
jgi:hypothetical protein